ncbi:unnamed protein product [Ixodes persulcatus]
MPCVCVCKRAICASKVPTCTTMHLVPPPPPDNFHTCATCRLDTPMLARNFSNFQDTIFGANLFLPVQTNARRCRFKRGPGERGSTYRASMIKHLGVEKESSK